MSAIAALLRRDAPLRRFFFAHAQSSLGSGAADVAILVLVYQRSGSAWALALVLLADFLPEAVLDEVLAEFPKPEGADWFAFDSPLERKLATKDDSAMGEATPVTACPMARSSTGRHGTRLKSRARSISAKRPLLSVSMRR